MKSWLFGFIVGLLVLPLLAYVYVVSGQMPVATSAPQLPLERYVTQKALNAVVDKNAPKTSPVPPFDANWNQPPISKS